MLSALASTDDAHQDLEKYWIGLVALLFLKLERSSLIENVKLALPMKHQNLLRILLLYVNLKYYAHSSDKDNLAKPYKH